jgi:hypothetical protein
MSITLYNVLYWPLPCLWLSPLFGYVTCLRQQPPDVTFGSVFCLGFIILILPLCLALALSLKFIFNLA